MEPTASATKELKYDMSISSLADVLDDRMDYSWRQVFIFKNIHTFMDDPSVMARIPSIWLLPPVPLPSMQKSAPRRRVKSMEKTPSILSFGIRVVELSTNISANTEPMQKRQSR